MNTTNNFRRLAMILTLAVAFTACKKDNDTSTPEEDVTAKEHKYVRVLVSDELTSQLNLVDPFAGTITAFNGKYPLANLYATASGRYAAVLYGSQNLAETVEIGRASCRERV